MQPRLPGRFTCSAGLHQCASTQQCNCQPVWQSLGWRLSRHRKTTWINCVWFTETSTLPLANFLMLMAHLWEPLSKWLTRQHHGTSQRWPGLPTPGPCKATFLNFASGRNGASFPSRPPHGGDSRSHVMSPKSNCLRNMAPNSEGSRPRVSLVPTGALNWNTSEFLLAKNSTRHTATSSDVNIEKRDSENFQRFPTFQSSLAEGRWWGSQKHYLGFLQISTMALRFGGCLMLSSISISKTSKVSTGYAASSTTKMRQSRNLQFLYSLWQLGFFLNGNLSSFQTPPALHSVAKCSADSTQHWFRVESLGFRVVRLERRFFNHCWIWRTSSHLHRTCNFSFWEHTLRVGCLCRGGVRVGELHKLSLPMPRM